MNLHRPLRLALFVALSASAASTFGLSAQPVDPAATPQAGEPVVTGTGSDLPTVADEGEVDRRCLKHTGSRVTADPSPQTEDDRTKEEQEKCAMGPGTVYTREDLYRTGRTTIEDALRALNPPL